MRDGRGLVKGDWDRLPHLAPSMTDGWRGLRLGLPQSAFDMTVSAAGVANMTWLGYQLRPVLAPVTLRERPLPVLAKVSLAVLGLLPLAVATRWVARWIAS